MKMKPILILFISFFFFACTSGGPVKTEADNALNPFSAMVRFYRGPLNHLSAVRIGECPMYPSDSTYSLQAMEKHGMFVGWMMSLDRLMRCGRDEPRLTPKVLVNGKWKSYDPVENNDFWWFPPTLESSTP
jgi:putative component of membrane protein insertase Oxa1/YidC/SpoIIIJ protein YidD